MGEVGEPNNFGGWDESVALMHFSWKRTKEEYEAGAWADGTWYDAPASFTMPFPLCEQPLGQTNAARCPRGWHAFGDSCYHVHSSTSNYHDADRFCSDHASHLVSIASVEEQVAVERICGERMCWLGFMEKPGTESWYWSDGTPEKFTNWHQGEPNNFDGVDENRAMTNFNFFEFSASSRSRRAVRFVAVLAFFGVLCGLCGLAFWSVIDPDEEFLLNDEVLSG